MVAGGGRVEREWELMRRKWNGTARRRGDGREEGNEGRGFFILILFKKRGGI